MQGTSPGWESPRATQMNYFFAQVWQPACLVAPFQVARNRWQDRVTGSIVLWLELPTCLSWQRQEAWEPLSIPFHSFSDFFVMGSRGGHIQALNSPIQKPMSDWRLELENDIFLCDSPCAVCSTPRMRLLCTDAADECFWPVMTSSSSSSSSCNLYFKNSLKKSAQSSSPMPSSSCRKPFSGLRSSNLTEKSGSLLLRHQTPINGFQFINPHTTNL